LLAHAGDFAAAFEQLLEVVLRDKNADAESWREKARKQLVQWFEVCPDPEVVSQGRRYWGCTQLSIFAGLADGICLRVRADRLAGGLNLQGRRAKRPAVRRCRRRRRY